MYLHNFHKRIVSLLWLMMAWLPFQKCFSYHLKCHIAPSHLRTTLIRTSWSKWHPLMNRSIKIKKFISFYWFKIQNRIKKFSDKKIKIFISSLFTCFVEIVHFVCKKFYETILVTVGQSLRRFLIQKIVIIHLYCPFCDSGWCFRANRMAIGNFQSSNRTLIVYAIHFHINRSRFLSIAQIESSKSSRWFCTNALNLNDNKWIYYYFSHGN